MKEEVWFDMCISVMLLTVSDLGNIVLGYIPGYLSGLELNGMQSCQSRVQTAVFLLTLCLGGMGVEVIFDFWLFPPSQHLTVEYALTNVVTQDFFLYFWCIIFWKENIKKYICQVIASSFSPFFDLSSFLDILVFSERNEDLSET